MRLYIKVENKNYRNISKWVKENLVESIPPCSDPERGGLRISSGSRFTHIKFDVFELDNKADNWKTLDWYMTNLMRDFSHRYLDKLPHSECWYEYLRESMKSNTFDKKPTKNFVPMFIVHKKGAKK